MEAFSERRARRLSGGREEQWRRPAQPTFRIGTILRWRERDSSSFFTSPRNRRARERRTGAPPRAPEGIKIPMICVRNQPRSQFGADDDSVDGEGAAINFSGGRGKLGKAGGGFFCGHSANFGFWRKIRRRLPPPPMTSPTTPI